ncbi:MAG: helix-turn-helix domain-containing protein [Bacilli bacterium]|nr:helix-turn-helix domain-containing protein [Bacilli bacterium]
MFSFLKPTLNVSHSLAHLGAGDNLTEPCIDHRLEVLILLSGSLSYIGEDGKGELKAGGIILIRPGTLHRFAVQEEECEYYLLQIDQSILQKDVAKRLLSGKMLYKGDNRIYGLLRSFDDLIGLYPEKDLTRLFECKLEEFAIFLANKVGAKMELLKEGMINRISKYVNENIAKDLPLKELSLSLSYSESYLSNSFKKAMNYPIVKYIRKKKAIYAHELIANGLHPIEVAKRCSYDHYSTFYRSYLKSIGCPPSFPNKSK